MKKIFQTMFLGSILSLGVVTIATAATVYMKGPTTKHISTLQVKAAVQKRHKGRIIYIKRMATPSHPNCHTVKMITTTGEFRYIRYACK